MIKLILTKGGRLVAEPTKSKYSIMKEFCKYPDVIECDIFSMSYVNYSTQRTLIGKINKGISSLHYKRLPIPLWAIKYDFFADLFKDNFYVEGTIFKSKKKLEDYFEIDKRVSIDGKINYFLIIVDDYEIGKNIKIHSVWVRYKHIKNSILLNHHCQENIGIPDLHREVFLKPDMDKIKGFMNLTHLSKDKLEESFSFEITFDDFVKLFKDRKIITRFFTKQGNVLKFESIQHLLQNIENKKIVKLILDEYNKGKNYIYYEGELIMFDPNEVTKLKEQILIYLTDKDLKEILSILKRAKSIPKVSNKKYVTRLQNMGLKAELSEYQEVGVSWLYELYLNSIPGAILGDGMGLGKTLQAIGFLMLTNSKKITIVSPASLVGNWKKEINKFYPKLLNNVTIISYHKAMRSKIDADIIVLDEGQYVKNPGTLAATILRNSDANFKLILTGTPIENTVKDLFSLIMIIFPNSHRMLNILYNNISKRDELKSIELTKQLIDGIYLARNMNKTIVPTKFILKNEFIQISEEERAIYDNIREIYSNKLKQIESNTLYYNESIVGLQRLIQSISNPAQLPDDLIPDGIDKNSITPSKLIKLKNHINNIRTRDEKAIVFAIFKQTIDLLKQELGGNKVLVIDGSTPKVERDKNVDLFQQDPQYDVFVISLKAGATGLTLTAANHVFMYDLWWNPAIESQAFARAYRRGQTKDVFASRLIGKDTIDEVIFNTILRKTSLIDAMKGKKTSSSKSNIKIVIDAIFG